MRGPLHAPADLQDLPSRGHRLCKLARALQPGDLRFQGFHPRGILAAEHPPRRGRITGGRARLRSLL